MNTFTQTVTRVMLVCVLFNSALPPGQAGTTPTPVPVQPAPGQPIPPSSTSSGTPSPPSSGTSTSGSGTTSGGTSSSTTPSGPAPGTQVTMPHGETGTVNPDGSITVTQGEGRATYYPEGGITVEKDSVFDSMKVRLHVPDAPKNSTWHLYSRKIIVVLPDGTRVTGYPGGSVEIRYPDGTVTYCDPDGTSTVIEPESKQPPKAPTTSGTPDKSALKQPKSALGTPTTAKTKVTSLLGDDLIGFMADSRIVVQNKDSKGKATCALRGVVIDKIVDRSGITVTKCFFDSGDELPTITKGKSEAKSEFHQKDGVVVVGKVTDCNKDSCTVLEDSGTKRTVAWADVKEVFSPYFCTVGGVTTVQTAQTQMVQIDCLVSPFKAVSGGTTGPTGNIFQPAKATEQTNTLQTACMATCNLPKFPPEFNVFSGSATGQTPHSGPFPDGVASAAGPVSPLTIEPNQVTIDTAQDMGCELTLATKNEDALNCMLTVTNPTMSALKIILPSFTYFASPNAAKSQNMMKGCDPKFEVPAKSTINLPIDTFCVSTKSIKTPPEEGLSYQVTNPPDADTFNMLARIVETAQLMDSKGEYTGKVFVKPEMRFRKVAQTAIWLYMGEKSGKQEDFVSIDTLQDELLGSLQKQPTKEELARVRQFAQGIYDAAKITVEKAKQK